MSRSLTLRELNEYDLVHCFFVQYLPRAVVNVLECLEQHAGVARVLDVQMSGFNDIVEERLNLSVAKVASISVKGDGAFCRPIGSRYRNCY